MQEMELTSARLLRVWWAFAWRFAALWFVMSATVLVAAILSVFVLMRAGVLTEAHAVKMSAHMMLAIVLASVPVAGIIATRLTLQGSLGGCRLALLANQPADEPAVSSAA